jgi:O-antigen/teichoic acid export membrane protein
MHNIAFLILGRVWQVAISIIFTKLVVTLLDPVSLSNYYLVLSIIMFSGLGFAGPLGNFFTRNYLESDPNKLIGYLLKKTLVLSLAVFIATISYLYVVDNESFLFVALIVIADFIINTVFRSFLSILNLEGKQSRFVLYNNIPLTFTVIVMLFLTNFDVSFSANSLLLIIFIGKSISLFILVVNDVNVKVDSGGDFNALPFCLPLFFTAILIWTQTYSYRFVLEYKSLFYLIGIIGVLQTLATQFISNIQSIFIQYFNPIFYNKLSEGADYLKYWKRGFVVQLAFYLLIILVVYITSNFILPFFLTDKFTVFDDVFIVLLFSESVRALNSHINLIFYASNRTYIILYSTVLGLFTPVLILFWAESAFDVSFFLCLGIVMIFLVNSILAVNMVKEQR